MPDAVASRRRAIPFAAAVWLRVHARSLGLDADQAPLRVVGIGDPSGDVFGNGMQLSSQMR